MSKLISLHKTESDTEELDEVSFDPIPLGSNASKTIYVNNLTEQIITIDPTVTDISGSGTVELVSYDEQIGGGERAAIELEASAINTETISGISANISVDAVAIVGPDQKI